MKCLQFKKPVFAFKKACPSFRETDLNACRSNRVGGGDTGLWMKGRTNYRTLIRSTKTPDIFYPDSVQQLIKVGSVPKLG